MATGGWKQEKDKKSSGDTGVNINGVGGALLFTGGAIVGAAVLYGMKKLYNHFTTKPPEEDDLDLLKPEKSPVNDTPSSHSSSRSNLNISPDVSPTSVGEDFELLGASPNVLPIPILITPDHDDSTPSPDSSAGSLHDCLIDYYANYVDVPALDYQIALTVVDDVKASLRVVMNELLPNCPVERMIDIGLASEGLAVIRPDHFQVGLQLGLNSKVWELVDAGDTLLSAHGYQMVKRSNLEFFSRGTSFYDRFLIGEYLSPVKVKNVFLDLTNRVSNWKSRHNIQSTVIGPEVKLVVRYGDGMLKKDKTMTIEFIPIVKMNGVDVMAQPHPRCEMDSCYENLWMQSFRVEEMKYLTSWKAASPIPNRPSPGEEKQEMENYGDTNEKRDPSLSDLNPENLDSGDGNNTTEDIADTETKETEMELSQSARSNEANGKANEETQNELSIEGCQLICLKVLEAIRINHPAQFRAIDDYVIRTTIMTLMSLEDGWFPEQLSERFLDSLKLLEEYLRAGQLPHFFNPKVNLLQDFSPGSIDIAREFIASVIRNKKFHLLLKKMV